MFKKYSANYYLRMPSSDLIDNLSPEFKAHLRVLFQVSNLDSVALEFAANNEVIFHFKGEK